MVFSRICLLAMLVAVISGTQSVAAQTAKASDWVGRVVVTVDGELVGRIEDFAIDVEHKSIEFVVVSIGSFLIDDNLIAVHPDALGESDDGRYLVVYTDTLDSADRFGNNNWPGNADVLATADRQPVAIETLAAEDATRGFTQDRVATISNEHRTATIKAGERDVQINTIAGESAPKIPIEVQPKRFQDSASEPLLADSEFERLDDNGDGYLSRSEIGSRLNRDVRYQDYDVDGNEGLDAFEFQILKARG